ncbi:MAG: DUF4176 domain-containing protein [Clostridia bacterium]|nr:DUF4176 domain-containing protein [Clostridia bacterium]
MNNNGLLPIGSVVLLNESRKKVMIVGVAQRSASSPDTIWDYSGVLFPEGYLGADNMILFNNEQITQLFVLGYQNAEQLAFKAKADAALEKLRGK